MYETWKCSHGHVFFFDPAKAGKDTPSFCPYVVGEPDADGERAGCDGEILKSTVKRETRSEKEKRLVETFKEKKILKRAMS